MYNYLSSNAWNLLLVTNEVSSFLTYLLPLPGGLGLINAQSTVIL